MGLGLGLGLGLVGGCTLAGSTGEHATQMPQVASQMPSFMLKRSGQRPSASCSAQVGSL